MDYLSIDVVLMLGVHVLLLCRNNLGEGGGPLCCSWWISHRLCEAGTACHGAHNRRLLGRVRPENAGDVVKETGWMGKRPSV